MCFKIHPDFPDVLTAEEDIEVYKVMKVTRSIFGVKRVTSNVYSDFTYKFNKLQVAAQREDGNPIIEFEPYGDNIDVGFHSWISKRQTDFHIDLYTRVIKCIIPKGTKHYRNESSGEMVSTHIIFKEVL